MMFKKKYEVYATATDLPGWEKEVDTFRTKRHAERFAELMRRYTTLPEILYHVGRIGFRHYSYRIQETASRYRVPYELEVFYKGDPITQRWEIGHARGELRKLAYTIAADHRDGRKEPQVVEEGYL